MPFQLADIAMRSPRQTVNSSVFDLTDHDTRIYSQIKDRKFGTILFDAHDDHDVLL